MNGSVNDWIDLMPHRIVVKTVLQLDDYGYPIGEAHDVQYACLLDDKTTVEYTLAGPRQTIVHVAYVNPYPINGDGFSTLPAIITAETVIWTPDDVEHEITSVATHYDETGAVHNQEVAYN